MGRPDLQPPDKNSHPSWPIMPAVDFKLLLIGDRSQSRGRSLVQVVEAAGRAGVSAVQFREKDLSLLDQLILAREVQAVTRRLGMKLLINDRVDLCLALEADGVHLPSSGLPVRIARSLLGVNRLIGRSCHGVEEVMQAEFEGADYVLFGPIYETPSKRPYGAPLGVNLLRSAVRQSSLPIFAVGGMKKERLQEVLEAGAFGVAMISEIGLSPEIEMRCREVLGEVNLSLPEA